MTRGGWIISAVVLAAAVGVGAWRVVETRDAGASFSAMGGSWILKDAYWVQNGGPWRVSGVVAPKNVQRAVNGNIAELMRAFCGGVLERLPDAPEGVTRGDVYRVSLNVEQNGGTRFLPAPLPVAVRDGACVEDSREVIYPALGGAFAAWEFRGLSNKAVVPADAVALTVAPVAGLVAPIEDRSAARGLCSHLMRDILDGDLPASAVLAGMIDDAAGGVVVRMVAPPTAGAVGRFADSRAFDVDDAGECTPREGL